MRFNPNFTSLKIILVFLAFCSCAQAEKPNIGLIYTTEALQTLETEGRDTRQTYRDALEEQGAVVVILGQTQPPSVIQERLESLNGVLLPGGIDVDPCFYGEERDPKLEDTEAALDQFEFRVLDHARSNGLPVLGICRGHQLLNVYYGGSLIQDIPSRHKSEVEVKHRYTPWNHPDAKHLIMIEEGSMLHDLLGVKEIETNTIHHQAVKQLADGFKITARSADGIVEAMESKGSVFIMGVQFHPERMFDTEPRMKAIFKRFVEEAEKITANRGGTFTLLCLRWRLESNLQLLVKLLRQVPHETLCQGRQ